MAKRTLMSEIVDRECPVCYETISQEDGNLACCRHLVHHECIRKSMRDKCPLCRASGTGVENIHKPPPPPSVEMQRMTLAYAAYTQDISQMIETTIAMENVEFATWILTALDIAAQQIRSRYSL